MKIFWIVLAIAVAGLLINALVAYLLQRKRSERAMTEGVVVYATVVSVTDVGGWAKYAQMKRIVLRVQEPKVNAPRDVTLKSRLPPNQTLSSGMKVPVAIDPKDAKRVYPATPAAVKRITLTGSRQERRMMRAQGM